ncbi:MAG: hypothetical protein ACFFC0_09255, partial [Promethearchaeota archaeon]
MSGDTIVDYSRQGRVNLAFAAILIVCVAFAVFRRVTTSDINSVVVELYIVLPVVLMLTSVMIGALSKRAIDYVQDEWEERKIWVSFSDYEKMVEEYEDAYGHLYGNPGGCAWIFCMLPLAFAFGFLSS